MEDTKQKTLNVTQLRIGDKIYKCHGELTIDDFISPAPPDDDAFNTSVSNIPVPIPQPETFEEFHARMTKVVQRAMGIPPELLPMSQSERRMVLGPRIILTDGDGDGVGDDGDEHGEY